MGLTTLKVLSHYQRNLNYVWDVGTLDWVAETQPGSGGGGGGDASAANQTTEIARLTEISDVLGTQADGHVDWDGDGTISGRLRTIELYLFGVQDSIQNSVSIARLNGENIGLGNGVVSTGTLRVAVASDSGGQTKVIPSYPVLWVSSSTAASGNTAVVTPASGKAVRVHYVSYNPSSDQNEIAFRFGAAGAKFLLNTVPAGSIIAKDFGDAKYVTGAIDEVFYFYQGFGASSNYNVFYSIV